MRQTLVRQALALVIALAPGVSLSAQPAEQPTSLQLDGAAPLARVGQATRVQLLGLVELYAIALYLPDATADRSRMALTDTPKALRFDIKYDPDLRPRVFTDWRRELVPVVDASAMAHLRGTFAPLRAGDVVLVAYIPNKGTTVRINKSVAVSLATHDLMAAFLDHWLGQTPVSEEIKRALGGT
jgi:hypothetical protein